MRSEFAAVGGAATDGEDFYLVRNYPYGPEMVAYWHPASGLHLFSTSGLDEAQVRLAFAALGVRT